MIATVWRVVGVGFSLLVILAAALLSGASPDQAAFLNSSVGDLTIGFSVRCSTTMNAAKSTAEIANAVTIRVSPQPRSPASISAQVSDAMAPVTSTVPGMSVATCPDSRCSSGSTR